MPGCDRAVARELGGAGGTEGDVVSFGDRLAEVTAQRGRLCVGIDPHPQLLREWGLSVDAAGLERFAMICAEAFGPVAAVVKPQSAFFEAHGARGIAVLERVLGTLREAGALSILDGKRGDIGSTMDAYAEAYLAEGAPLAADAVTLSPFLGFGALEPAIELAARNGKGVFVLARTSNPEGAELQLARAETVSIAQSIVGRAGAWNADGSATVGLVVGATGPHGLELGALRGPILAPGFGAQGATVAELATVFGPVLGEVLPASSRAVLRNGPAVGDLRETVRSVTASLPA